MTYFEKQIRSLPAEAFVNIGFVMSGMLHLLFQLHPDILLFSCAFSGIGVKVFPP